MENYEKLADYKRAAKAFLRGVVKAGVFQNDNDGISLYLSKSEDDKTVSICVCNGVYSAKFEAAVATRIFNKFDNALFEDIGKIFNSRKNFGGISIR